MSYTFDRDWPGMVRLVYGWEEDMTQLYEMLYPGPVTAGMPIPTIMVILDRTYAFKEQKYGDPEAEAKLKEICNEVEIDYEDVIRWAIGPDDYIRVGRNESGGSELVRRRNEVFELVQRITNVPVRNPDDKYYSCGC